MLIPCPWCGERAHTEFAYGGDATVRRPARPDEASDSDWYAYLYLRQNPRGPHRELWFHEFGCEQWVEVERDTLTHAVTSVNAAGERRRSAPCPARPSVTRQAARSTGHARSGSPLTTATTMALK